MPRAYFNPFYLLSVIIGIAFLITATAYGVMAFRGATPHLLDDAQDSSSVMVFLSKYGALLFMIELGALMVTTIAAIATDEYWSKGSEDSENGDDPQPPSAGDAQTDSDGERDTQMQATES